ncbi:MAG: glycoside hydrolase family 76 protein [Candidatus Omnitrophica bacterium]|nr:glycoside hydrolase family 76 protein [Candidatus Omnitrophota bacterium]
MLYKNKKSIPEEHRKYLRLDTVFPVEFRLKKPGEDIFLSDWVQGFTNNISKGGICLTVNSLDARLFEIIRKKNAKLLLEIDVPVSRRPVLAQASIAWVKEILDERHRYLIGISYDLISARQNIRLMRYAWLKKLFVPVTLFLVILLTAGLGLNSYLNYKLTQGNKLLIGRLTTVLKAADLAQQKIKEVAAQKESFAAELNVLQERIRSVEAQKESIQAIQKGDLVQIEKLNNLISGLSEEKTVLEEKLAEVVRNETKARKELTDLGEKKAVLEKANFDNMYRWLKIHQNSRTGLVSSFEGDKEIANWSFTYDLALLAQAYSRFSDFERARKILDFFAHRAKRENGWFLNAYYVDDGGPAEFIMHCGPNIWLGLAVMQYTHFSQDQRYLDLAESIAATMIKLQNEDAGGGLRGGPNVTWYSTEHNLDAYAFFTMLAEVTGKEAYSRAAQKVLTWMLNNTYDRPELPVKRGKGDSTIATDTYAWSIAAIGPEKLFSLGMDPDKIMEFVEESCSVEVDFTGLDGKTVKVKGFDFAPLLHTARGGVVSSEWTAQMVVSYKIMEDFYLKKGDKAKADEYGRKARMYLGELCKMIISSPSPSGQGEGCLPYATQDQVSTGHGWSTPKGSHTGSVSGTTYTLFAYYGFNPLELKE